MTRFVRLTEVDGEDSETYKLAIRKTTSHLRKEEPNVYPNLSRKIKEKGNPTVAGLDARLEYIPQHISGRNMMLHGETLRAAAESVVAFNCGLIDALCDIVPAVKPQAAYYELLGSYGAMALKETIDYAHAKGMYVIGDIKRNDIGATATAYAEAYLGKTRVGDTEIAPYGCDSVTVNGYLAPTA